MGSTEARILVVEDELGLQRLIRRRAEQEQLEVMTALTIADGLSLCRTGRPDLIVLDLHLPDGQGIEMLRRLKSDPQTAKIPIVAWSGSGDVSEEDDILLAGADAYCSKLDLRALFVTILELLRRVAGVPGN